MLLLIVILATLLGHGSCDDLSQFLTCKVKDDKLVDVSQLVDIGVKAIRANDLSHNEFFDGQLKTAAEYIFDLVPTNSAKKPVQNTRDGCDYMLNAIPVALGKQCHGIEKARKKIHASIDKINAAFIYAVELVENEKYYGDRGTINDCQAEARNEVVRLIKVIFDEFCTCLNSTSNDALAAIQTAENGTVAFWLDDLNAGFNAVKLLDEAINHGYRNLSLINDMEEFKAGALATSKYTVYRTFAVYEALFINSRLLDRTAALSSPVTNLNANQYATNMRSNNLAEVIVIIYGRVSVIANRIVSGISVSNDDIVTLANFIAVKVKAALKAESEYFFESVLIIQPDDNAAVEEARKNILVKLNAIGDMYAQLMIAAGDRSESYSGVIAKISGLIHEVDHLAVEFIYILISLIHHKETWSEEFEAIFALKSNESYNEVIRYFGYFEDLMKIFATVSHFNNTACYGDYISAIEVAKNGAIAALDAYTQNLADAFQFSFLAGSGNGSSP